MQQGARSRMVIDRPAIFGTPLTCSIRAVPNSMQLTMPASRSSDVPRQADLCSGRRSTVRLRRQLRIVKENVLGVPAR